MQILSKQMFLKITVYYQQNFVFRYTPTKSATLKISVYYFSLSTYTDNLCFADISLKYPKFFFF